jgi:hypothetical protein
MKAEKNVPQTNVPQKPKKRVLNDIKLAQLDADKSGVMHSSFGYLLDALKNPTMDNSHTEVCLAYGRICALTGALQLVDHSVVSDSWEPIASLFELNAGIMRYFFELVFDRFEAETAEIDGVK